MLNLKSKLSYCLFFNVISCASIFAFSIEELKGIHYEVEIFQTPLKKDLNQAVMYMTSKYGQEYQCALPQLDDDDVSEKETVSEKNTDVKQLLKSMQSGSCLLKGKDWWTYEFCFGHYIKQFHIEDGQILGQVITLGLYESDYDWNNETDLEKFKHVKQKYHSQFYTNGTKCDLTGQPRNAEVRFFCEEDAGDYIHRVDEPGTCSYILTVHTSRLCSHPQLKPLPSNKAYSIPCHPVLNEEQYSQYLLKLKEENALAEDKRLQWLIDQQVRLQFLKDVDKFAKKNALKDSKENPDLKDSDFNIDFSETSKQETVKEELAGKDGIETPDSQQETLQKEEESMDKMKKRKLSIKASIVEDVYSILNKAEEEMNLEMSGESNSDSEKKLPSLMFQMLDEMKKFKDSGTASPNDETDGIDDSIKDTEVLNSEIESDDTSEKIKPSDDEPSSSVLDDDKLYVRIRRLDRKSVDPNSKLYEMDVVQKKKLEQAIKEKLEKAGLDTGGRRIEVNIITAGVFDHEDGKDFHSLSDEETSQFQNMIMALLTGQQEAVQEMERHKKLEENYKFTWESSEDEKDD